MGNIGSILNMLKKVGAKAKLVCSAEELSQAEKIILPGVGRFDRGMENLRKSGMYEVLQNKALVEKVPILGVCMGMQLMCEHGEEGDCAGLSWVPARVKKFKFENDQLKVPHMAWNYIDIQRKHTMLEGLDDQSRFYFVHSYYVEALDPEIILTNSFYGLSFVSGFARGNLVGFQFHPEKSHRFGMQIYKNFVHWQGL